MTTKSASQLTRSPGGFTLVEVFVATSVFSLVMIGLFSFTAFSMRMVSRNLATNRTHEVVRMSNLQFLRYIHEASSPFTLVNYNGTNYSDVTSPAATTDVETMSGRLITARSNGVRFRRFAGGPYKLKSDVGLNTTTLAFDFSVNGAVPYIPAVGDKLSLPVIDKVAEITAVSGTPTTGAPIVNITIASGLGYTLNATNPANITTGYFYSASAFTVWDGQLRYHKDFSGSRKNSYVQVRDSITSPLPFGLLYRTGSATVDNTSLRVSLEAYDGSFSARAFTNGTTTLKITIPTLLVTPPIRSD